MSQPFFHAFPLRAAALAALCVAAAAQTAQATNGYFSHGYGVKSQAIAGVGIALPQDGLTAATNPAGTAFTGTRLDVGATCSSQAVALRSKAKAPAWTATTAPMAVNTS